MFLNIIMITLFLVLVVYILFYLLSYKMMYNEETSSGYECGFNFISKTRMGFSYRFFLIGMLFLIFDIEIVLLLSVPFLMESNMMMIMMILFILVLILGLMYEYYCGSLEWL